jgi:DNA-binding CsgD family transcriptional regulator
MIAQPLTPRQREIVRMIAEGNSTKEIAFLLEVSIKTIESHRLQLMDRLDIHHVAGLVRYAMWIGLVPPGRCNLRLSRRRT